MMKAIWFGTVATVALLGISAASAADLGPRYTKAPPMAPIFSWTGFYIGANAGYAFSDSDNLNTTGQALGNINNVNGGARPANVRLDRDGFAGGGQIGYNWQTSPNWVWGIEADIAYTDLRRTTTVTTVPLLNAPGTLANTFTSNLEYLGTVRGRVGYAFDRTMVYATGGLAYGDVRNGANFFGTAATGNNLQFTGSNRETKTGYTVGGGIEHAFAGAWSVKAEYLYYDLGRDTVNVAIIPGALGAGGSGYNTRFENDGHLVRVGLNYRFGGGY